LPKFGKIIPTATLRFADLMLDRNRVPAARGIDQGAWKRNISKTRLNGSAIDRQRASFNCNKR
jgi:hypothetical protein